MAIQKFVTIDLETGKKILKTLEASYVKFSDSRLPEVDNLDAALKAEITRALAAEKVLDDDIKAEVQRAKDAEQAIKSLIGDLAEDASVKAALTRIEGLISSLTVKVDNHIADNVKHITAEERTKWDKTTTDLAGKADAVHTHAMSEITGLEDAMASKADESTVTEELNKKVAKTELIADGKIKTELLPSIAINSVATVASVEAAMELVIENGDVVIINPDVQSVKEKDQVKVISGTFICVDATQELFENRFRQLYSNSDSISKADVENLIKIETDRATNVENELQQQITTEKNEESDGSLANKIKSNKTAIEAEVTARTEAVKAVNDKVDIINGGEEVSGSIANAVKVEKDRAVAAEGELDRRLNVVEPIVTKLNGGKEVSGSVENLTEAALNTAKEYTNQEVAKEKTAREAADTELRNKIDSLEANEDFKIQLGFAGAETTDLVTVRADGNVVKAQLSDSSVVGIIVEANDEQSKTVVMGKVGGFEGLIPGKNYFLGANGKISPTIPTEVGQNIIKIGVAISATELFVNIQDAIEIRA